MKKTLIFLALIGFCVAIFSQTKTEPQPPPLRFEIGRIEPILENANLGPNYWLILTLKLYYTDTMDKPLPLRNSEMMIGYCSDLTELTFIGVSDSLKLTSLKNLNCVILAYFNIDKTVLRWLLDNDVIFIKIKNLVTDNEYKTAILDTGYFRTTFRKYGINLLNFK